MKVIQAQKDHLKSRTIDAEDQILNEGSINKIESGEAIEMPAYLCLFFEVRMKPNPQEKLLLSAL